MVPIQQRLLTGLIATLALTPLADAQKFRADDPMLVEPRPHAVGDLKSRSIDDIYDFAYHSFVTEKTAVREKLEGKWRPSLDVNTLGELPDSPWYTNRHRVRRMTPEEIAIGPGNTNPPSSTGSWKVVSAKSDGITPGFVIEDDKQNRYLLKLDPPLLPELASGTDMIGSKLFYALGYSTAENYIVKVDPKRLDIQPGTTYTDEAGRKRPITRAWVNRLLRPQPRDEEGRIRVLASLFVPGKVIGPFRYRGTRTDDPNDIWAHEDRRVLRGLNVFCAWLNHTDSRAINSLDTVQTIDGVPHVRHYLIDFGSILGSDSVKPKDPGRGHTYDIEMKPMGRNILTLGLVAYPWERVNFPKIRGIGNFEADIFEPRKWKSAYPNPAFLRMDEQDAFWAAKQIAQFTDADLDRVAQVAGYTDPRATEYMALILKKRRDLIAAAYLNLPLRFDNFRVAQGRLAYDDLSLRVSGATPKQYSVAWSKFDNSTGARSTIASIDNLDREAANYRAGEILCAEYTVNGAPQHGSVRAFLRRGSDGWKVVGVERQWPPVEAEKQPASSIRTTAR